MRRAGVILVLALSWAGVGAAAQAGGRGPVLSSETGTYAEGYSISGLAARRPGNTVRMYASPTFQWLGFTIGVNLLWSTEQSFVAQPLNRYYLNPRWSWGQVHAGDYVPQISSYTASSVRIRGGGIDLTPGKFRLSFAAGRSQEATDLSVFDAAPQRTLVAGSVGYGDPFSAPSFFQVSALHAIDNRNGADSLSAPPQENAVATVAGGVGLLGGRLRLRGDASASLFSRDIRAGALDSLGQPAWTRSLFTARVSSRIDRAWSTEARLALRPGSVGARFSYVGPGFTTLGDPYLVNDQRDVKLFGTVRLLHGRVSGNASLGERSDNLAADKVGTTKRWTGSVGLAVLTGQWLISTVSVARNSITLNPTPTLPAAPLTTAPDSFRLANSALSVAWGEQARFKLWGLPQQVGLSVSAQQVDASGARYGSVLNATSRTLTVEYGVTFGGTYYLSVRPGYQRFRGASIDQHNSSVAFGVSRRAARSAFSGSVTSTLTGVINGWQFQQNLSLTYRVSGHDALAAQLRYTDAWNVTQPYRETLASLRYTRRW